MESVVKHGDTVYTHIYLLWSKRCKSFYYKIVGWLEEEQSITHVEKLQLGNRKLKPTGNEQKERNSFECKGVNH